MIVLDVELFEPDEPDPFELDELEPLELLLPDDEDELADPEEEELEEVVELAREKENPPALPLPEVRFNSGT